MNRAMRFVEGFLALCRDAIEFLGPAATFGSGLAGPRFYESLLLQPVEAGVNRADRDIFFGLIEQFLTDGDAIGAIVEPENDQQ